MKIGIDARLIKQTGVGRYIQNLIRELSIIDRENQYVVYLRKNDAADFHIPNARWSTRKTDVGWHSFKEQLVMPWLFMKDNLDLVHVPYFNAPILYTKKFILTIHDLTILHVDTGKATTLPYWMYKIRRIGYQIILSIGLKRSSRVIAVSNTVKNDVIRRFHCDAEKIHVTYEGIDPIFTQSKSDNVPVFQIPKKYFLYVGNVYPHKNIGVLLDAFAKYKKQDPTGTKLVFVGPADFFYRRLEKVVISLGLATDVVFLHGIADIDLRYLYRHAVALVFPSLMEGFGLPALEALACGCRVICSDIAVFKEILGEVAVYINPNDVQNLYKMLKQVSSTSYDSGEFKKRTVPLMRRFDWKQMAIQTLSLYAQVGKRS